MTESPLVDSGFTVPIFSPRDDPIACLNKVMAFLMAVASSRFLLTNNQLRTSSNPRNHATIQDGRVTVQQVQGRKGQSYSGTGYKSNATSFRGINTEDLDTYDSDCDDISNAKAVLMDNISNYGSDVISEAQQDSMILSVIEPMSKQMINHVNNWENANKEQNNELVTAELERYKERVKTFKQRLNIDLSCREKIIDSLMDDMIKEKLALKEQVDSLEQNLSKQIKEKECYQNPFYLKKAQRIKPTLYDGRVISAKHVAMPVIDDGETLILEEESRSKIIPSNASPVKIEAPKELPKVSLVNESLKSLNFTLPEFFENNNLKAQLQDKDSTICKLKDIIKSMREKSKEENVKYDYCDIETKNVKLENSVAKLISENERLCNEQFDSIKKTRVRTKEHSDSLIDKLNLKSAENEDLKAQIQDKVFMITSLKNDLRKLKGKEIVDIVAQTPYAHTIVPGMFKLDLEPLAPRLLQNREAHIEYLKYTQEQTDILRGIVEQAKAKQPLDKELDFSCKHAQRIQELLVYVRDTCPNATKLNEKKFAVTPKNKVKKVRFAEPLTSSGNIKQKSMFDGVHDMCLLDFVENVNGHAKSAKKHKKQNIWKPTGHVFTEVGFKWKPTGRTFTIVGNSCPLTRITSTNVVPPKKTISHSVETKKELKVYSRKPKNVKNVGSSKKAKIVESKNANHSEPNHTWGSNATNIPSSSFLVMTVRFRNDHIARIMGYGNYQLGNVTISRVYYVEGLGHNLFSVGQFCNADLEVAFWKNTCFIRNLEGVNLLSGSRDTNLYTISLDDMLTTSPICLLSKASKTKSWLWHRQLSHLNFGTLNKLAKDGPAQGIPRLKFQKDHLCLACALGKSKKSSHQPKAEDTNYDKLYLLHMDLCGPMRVASINGKRLYSLTPATSSSGLILNIFSQQPCIPPKRDDWDNLFQPMFDEYFTPPSIAVSPVQEVAAPRAVVLAESTVSTSIDQDAPL
ncbi:retrovirus-related pol polyprotein from transposon TNT 1-94 [Tanacetum coccineum]